MNQQHMNIFGLTRSELSEAFAGMGLPDFRAGQAYSWLYEKRVRSFDEMTNLGKKLREDLATKFSILYPSIVRTSESADGTKKFLLSTYKGLRIESVLIPAETDEETGEPKRLTLCISTQVGCPLDCRFCATGSMKFAQNLSPGEIVGQYFVIQAMNDERITNLVYMGMGEPLLNYDSVMQSVDLITADEVNGIGASRITISTAGLLPGIKRMADENRRVKLAVSLHSPDEITRTRLMPITSKYGLTGLLDAVEYYYKATRKPVTYEYIMFDAVNDSDEDLLRLVKIARRVPSKVNIIPFHSIEAAYPEGVPLGLKPASPARMEEFARALRKRGITVMFRSSSGEDIDAACGQLAVRTELEKNIGSREPSLN